MKKIVVSLLLLCSIFLVACSNSDKRAFSINSTTYADDIILQTSNVTKHVGDTFSVNELYTINPETVTGTISVSDTDILKVDNGNITCDSIGQANIIIEVDISKGSTLKKKISVNVVARSSDIQTIYCTGVTFEASGYSLVKGASGKINFDILPSNCNTSVELTSSDETVLTIDDEGNYSVLNYGKAVVTATYYISEEEINTASVEVSVVADVSEITLTSADTELNAKQKSLSFSEEINLTVTRGATLDMVFSAMLDGRDYQSFKFAYLSGNVSSKFNQIAGDFSSRLRLTANEIGTETLIISTQTLSEKSLTINITVVEYISASVSFNKESLEHNVKTSRTLLAPIQITPAQNDDLITFVSSNTNLATIDNLGEITILEGINAGNCTIYVYRNGEQVDSFELTIIDE